MMDSDKGLKIAQLRKNFSVSEAAYLWINRFSDYGQTLIKLNAVIEDKRKNPFWETDDRIKNLSYITGFKVTEQTIEIINQYEFYKQAIYASCIVSEVCESYYDEYKEQSIEYDHESFVERQELIKLAGKLNEKPLFLFPDEPQETPVTEKPPTYITPLMQLLNDAARKHWEGIEPTDRQAPTNENIVDWLIPEMEKRGLNKSVNIAKAIATIIRHPNKPK